MKLYLLFVFCFFTQACFAQKKIIHKPKVEMEILIPETRLDSIWSFKLFNNSNDTIFTSNIATLWNRIVIITPEGEELEYYLSTPSSIEIYPGETKFWTRDIWEEFFIPMQRKYKESSFSVFWKIYDRKKITVAKKHGVTKREYKTFVSTKKQIKL